MRRFYTFLFYLLAPLILLRLYWKGRRLASYRQRIKERFMFTRGREVKIDVWLHAVSFGEIIAAIPLLDAMIAKGWRVLITTMTPTGSEKVVSRFANKVQHQYVPYDYPWVLRRFFTRYNINVGIIMETELWPNLVHYANRYKIPLLLINARLSDHAFHKYEKLKFFFKPMLANFTGIMTQSEEDAQRFISLGATQNLVSVCGNIKFDLQMKIPNLSLCHDLKERWGFSRPMVIAASTHEGEEKQLLTAFKQLKNAIPNVLLTIAPRHPERFQVVYNLCQQMGFNTGLRSQAETINPNLDIMVIDSMGELLGFYQISDFAFVGGSLVPIGGHNVLEPIAMEVPVFTGPHMQNSKSICQDLCAVKAMQLFSNAEDIFAAIVQMYQDKVSRARQIASATHFLEKNKGSLGRYLQKIEELFQAVGSEG
jgi:3-deoxy-D-manno-octulosonic-acid transferase